MTMRLQILVCTMQTRSRKPEHFICPCGSVKKLRESFLACPDSPPLPPAYFLRLSKKWHFISAEMRWPFHSGQNEMNSILLWPKWTSHFGQNEMVISFWPKKMTISFWPKWDDHFIVAKMILITFHSSRNGHLISARMKCTSFQSGRNEMTISFCPGQTKHNPPPSHIHTQTHLSPFLKRCIW